MKARTLWMVMVSLGVALLVGQPTSMLAQSADPAPQSGAKITAEQKAQVNRLAQLEDQLQKSRTALHAAINEYGWDSDQADDAREKLVSDRAEYRNLRRSLRAAGVAVPPPSGLGAGSPGSGPGRGAGRWQGRHHGGHHCAHCDCDGGSW